MWVKFLIGNSFVGIFYLCFLRFHKRKDPIARTLFTVRSPEFSSISHQKERCLRLIKTRRRRSGLCLVSIDTNIWWHQHSRMSIHRPRESWGDDCFFENTRVLYFAYFIHKVSLRCRSFVAFWEVCARLCESLKTFSEDEIENSDWNDN